MPEADALRACPEPAAKRSDSSGLALEVGNEDMAGPWLNAAGRDSSTVPAK